MDHMKHSPVVYGRDVSVDESGAFDWGHFAKGAAKAASDFFLKREEMLDPLARECTNELFTLICLPLTSSLRLVLEEHGSQHGRFGMSGGVALMTA